MLVVKAENEKLRAIMDIIIDGVSLSEVGASRITASKEIVSWAMARYPHSIDREMMKKIESIMLLGE